MKRMLVLVACMAACGAHTRGPAAVETEDKPPPAATNPCPSPAGPEVARCLLVRVIAVAVRADGTEITLPVGTGEGVTTSWEGAVVDASGAELAPITIVRIDGHISIARTPLTAADVSRHSYVRLVHGDAPTPAPPAANDVEQGENCPSPPDRDTPACWAVMPCPDPPDRRIRACHLGHDCFDPSCPATPQPVTARVIKTVVEGGDVIIVLATGTDSGVGKDWHAALLRGDSDAPLAEVVLVRLDKRQTVARVHVPREQVEANPRVRLTPP